MPERQYSLAVLRFPGNNAEHPASSGWVITTQPKWLADKRLSRVFHLRRSDTPITMVRNLLVKTALAEGADYILMIDSDMQPDTEPDGQPFWDTSWDFLMVRREREEAHLANLMAYPNLETDEVEEFKAKMFRLYPPATVAAPYCGPPPHECVYAMKWANREGNTPDHPRPFAMEMFDREHAATFSGIFEVAALATGLILYDARVFRHLPPPWYDYTYTDAYETQKNCTEDIYQTKNAKILGMPQFCNWDAWAGHIKPKLVRRPRVLDMSDVPLALADAVRKGTRGDRKVVVISSEAASP